MFLWQCVFRVSDVGITVLLSFIGIFVLLAAKTLGVESLKIFGDLLPKSVYSARRLLGRDNVCYPKCSTLYARDQCILNNRNGTKISNTCSFIMYPDHPHQSKRNPCGTLLMKNVRTSAGATYLYPQQLYCYTSIIQALKEKVFSPIFIPKCEEWRNRTVKDNIYEDVFDGQMWKDFLNPNGIPFLSLTYNYALCLNVDWFQPFKHTQYSCGALYLTILNLPRSERYSTENVILLGVIPGPREPEFTINTFLQPFVEELLELWSGIVTRTHTSSSVLVRLLLFV